MLSFRVIYAIQLLSELVAAGLQGERLSVTELRTRCGLDDHSVTKVLARLRAKGWVNQVSYRHFVRKDLAEETLYDLVIAMDEKICMGSYCTLESWPYINTRRYSDIIELDKQLSTEVEERLRGILITEVISC